MTDPTTLLICGIILGVLVVLPWWRIFVKTGQPGWMSLGMLVPLLNLGLLFFLAFTRWPIEEEVEYRRRKKTSPPTEIRDAT